MKKIMILAIAMMVAGFAFGQECTVTNKDMYVTFRAGIGYLEQDVTKDVTKTVVSTTQQPRGKSRRPPKSISTSTSTTISEKTTEDYDIGGVFSLAIGKRSPEGYSVELEVSHQANTLTDDEDIKFSQLMLMLNGRYEFVNDTKFLPYVGAGIGISHGKYKDLDWDGSDNVFVFQGGIGTEYAVTKTFALDTGIRLVGTSDYKIATQTMSSKNAQVYVGISSRF